MTKGCIIDTGAELLAKKRIELKKSLVTVMFTILIAGILLSEVPSVNATGSVWVQPNQGKPGTLVGVNGGGFVGRVYFYFNGTGVATGGLPSGTGSVSGSFNVPNVPTGTYNVTASDDNGVTPGVIFTVLDANASPSPSASSSHTATPRPSSTRTVAPTGSGSTAATARATHRPTVSSSADNGFFSPLVIGVIAVVAVIVVLSLLFMLRVRGGGRGKRDDLLRRDEPPSFSPQPMSTPPTPPPASPSPISSSSSSRPYQTAAERYGRPTAYRPTTYGQQSASATVISRPATPSYAPSYSQQPSSITKICPHCKRTVKGDYSVCPYCYKRMK